MKKRVTLFLVITAVTVLFLVGCGESQETMGSAEGTEFVTDGASGEKEISIEESSAPTDGVAIISDGNKEAFLSSISSESLTDVQKQDAMVEMTAIAEKEAAAKVLLEAKGFKDVVVSINGDMVDVVVNVAELDEATRTQIEDIVTRKTEIPVENIVIRTVEDRGDILTLKSDIADTVALYMPGTYTSELVLGEHSIDVEVIVDKDNLITSIQMVNLSEDITMNYPLLVHTFDSICEQIYEQQSLENITYTADNKYTSLMLLDVIQNALNKAKEDY